jgi:hypothetical protein
MPQRKSIRRFPSIEVQGEDSWVEVSRLTVGEARIINEQQGKDNLDSFEAVLPLYQKHIIDWNWVDDDGKQLSLPKDEPGVVDQLTDQEFAFIANCLSGGDEETQKN